MNNLPLKAHDSGRLDIILVKDEALYIHADIKDFLRQRNIASVTGLVSFLVATPLALLKDDFMNQSELDFFRKEVFDSLKDILPAEAFVANPKRYGLGALIPKSNGTN